VQAPFVALLEEAGDLRRDIVEGLEGHRIDALDLHDLIRLLASAWS